jgi:hypothetical protein
VLQVGNELISDIELFIQGDQEILVSIDHLPALSTHQMNVRPMLVCGIDHLPFPQVNATDKTLLDQQFQGAIHCSNVYGAGPFLYPSEHFLCVDVIALMGDGFDNHLALEGDAKTT